MKPAAVINLGERFVTLRATTDRPAEIGEALANRGVEHIFKGDQNQAWDAVLANHCLHRAVGDHAEITLFVQDERLGTSDARLAPLLRRRGRDYVLTEDYYRGRSGAVWEHQDASYGLFFTEAVTPEQFAAAGVHLHRAAALWERHAAAARGERGWIAALAELGVVLPGGAGVPPAGSATGLGPAPAPEYAAFFRRHPAAELYHCLTKTDGLYGVVPVANENVTMSSIPAAHPELRAAGRWLLVHAAARGAMRSAAGAAARRGVARRARRLAEWAGRYLARHPHASVADFQAALGRWLTRELFPADRIELERTTAFTRLERAGIAALSAPEETLHFFLDLALRHPAEFTASYNEALNRVGFGLQRIKHDSATGRFTPPFFVEFAPRGPGTPVYRYGVELSGGGRALITLLNPTTGDVTIEAAGPVRSALEFARAVAAGIGEDGFSIVGKAAAFAAELQRAPRGLGLPRQGSKYAPMVDHLVSGLRDRGVLGRSTGLLIRIGLNALDRLEAMGEMGLSLPAFLHGALGRRVSCREFARRWRGVAGAAQGQLALLGAVPFGRHVHLCRLLAINARGGEPSAPDHPRLAPLLRALRGHPEGGRLAELGRELGPAVAECLERLLGRRDALLEERRALAAAEARRRPAGRLRPDPERLAEIERERERIELQLLLLLAAYARRLWQRARSLPYLNDRPYTLALYLLFGRDIFPPICRRVEFDLEYVSPVPELEEPGMDPVPCRCGRDH